MERALVEVTSKLEYKDEHSVMRMSYNRRLGDESREKKCWWCGYEIHQRHMCPAREAVCRSCGRKGHFSKMCKQSGVNVPNQNKNIQKQKSARYISGEEQTNNSETDTDSEEPCLQSIRSVSKRAPRASIDVQINGISVTMEFDSGARVSTIDKELWKKLGQPKFTPVKSKISGYGNNKLNTIGEATVKVKLGNKSLVLPVIVMEVKDVPLFGIPWMVAFNLSLPDVVKVREVTRIDEQLSSYVGRCVACQENRNHVSEVPLYPWNVPTETWERLHLDLAGPFDGHQWLIGIDAYSKWVEVNKMKSTTSAVVIRCLREWFGRYGIPKQIVTDNGPQFVSEQFKEFCEGNNIRHIKSTPYHPKTNGLAERFIRTFKGRYISCKEDVRDPDLALQTFLLSYRNTPQATTNISPAELFLGRRLMTRLDRVKPDRKEIIDVNLWKQKNYHDRRAKVRHFEPNQDVWVKNELRKGWRPGTVIRQTGELSYEVSIGGVCHRKHADQLRAREGAVDQEESRKEEQGQGRMGEV